MISKKKVFFCILLILLLTGCSSLGFVSLKPENSEEPKEQKIQTAEEVPPIQEQIIKHGVMSEHISSVYTTKKQLSLTFNGMSDTRTMEEILNKLDQYKIKATFFVPGNKIKAYPEIALEIITKGHEIENNTFNQQDVTTLPYEQIYKDIQESNTNIEEQTGITPKYIRATINTDNEDIRYAAAHVGLTAVVTDGINIHDWSMTSPTSFQEFVAARAKRGSIFTANVENPDTITAIPIMAEVIADIGYELVPLHQLMEGSYERKTATEDIPGYNVVRQNSDDTFYNRWERIDTNKKQVALTFNNWGSEQKITSILDILKANDVNGTFFIDPTGAENNPNLAKAIVEDGNDVGIRTYSPLDITQASTHVLQEEVIKGYQAITEAIQEQPAMLFRPDYGNTNKASSEILATMGIKNITLYDVDSKDWEQATTYEIVTNVLDGVQEGSIILLHMQDELNTVEALPMIIRELRNRGYSFVKVADM